jgi:hypothetical protein
VVAGERRRYVVKRLGTAAALCAAVLISGQLAAPAAAADKLPVEILGGTDLSGTGPFEVKGEGAALLCPLGTFEATNTRIEWLTEDSFKIWQDNVFTCDDTEQVFVLELKNTIVLGQGGLPGKGTWKLKTSVGFDPAPKGKGEIVTVESTSGPREAFVGLIK